MSNVVASHHGSWVVADVSGPRLMKKALREAIHPSRLVRDDVERWLIHEAAWPAACAVFWYFQLPVELDWASDESPAHAREAERRLPRFRDSHPWRLRPTQRS